MQSNKGNIILRQDLDRELNFSEADGNFGELKNVIDDAYLLDRKAFAASLGFIGVDSFQQGAILTTRNEILYDTGLQNYYRWLGAYPKTVPSGSTLATQGGLAEWELIDKADNEILSLRTDLTELETTVENISAFPLWKELKPYSPGFIVEGLNGKIYRALKNNTGQNPELVANTDEWEELRLTQVYNPNVQYGLGAEVITANGNRWKSMAAVNLNNTPAAGSVFWDPAVDLSEITEQINNLQIDDIANLTERLDEIETYALAGL
jgi:hypothetical protein